MIPELEKPRVTEIQVRMDCNGCIQKIKKALHGINGIYDLYIDFPQQKLTIIGWADPEKIVKAIKKTRKTATICVHTEPTEPPAQPTEPAPGNGTPVPDAAQPPAEAAPPSPAAEAAPTAEATQPAEATPPTEPPKHPPPHENPPPDVAPTPVVNNRSPSHSAQPSGPKDVEEVHVIHHHPPDHGYRIGHSHNYYHGHGGHWNNYADGPGPRFRHEPIPPVYVTHSYNTYKPSPYVTEYEYVRSSPQHTYYSRPERYSEEYYKSNSNSSSSNANISSMFSDENPNACRIV